MAGGASAATLAGRGAQVGGDRLAAGLRQGPHAVLPGAFGDVAPRGLGVETAQNGRLWAKMDIFDAFWPKMAKTRFFAQNPKIFLHRQGG